MSAKGTRARAAKAKVGAAGGTLTHEEILDCQSAAVRADELLTWLMDDSNLHHLLHASALTELLICLHELMKVAAKAGVGVHFTDDVLIDGDVKDVTDAVRVMRDACCHISSGRRQVNSPKTRNTFYRIIGKKRSANMDGFILQADYVDDIAYFYGKHRLYRSRHLDRAFDEVVTALRPLI
jgi:hypothetical protein